MRILHTSDWHLGRLFHRASLLDEQERALSRIVDLVRDEGVDLVVVAGDLYDRSVPPADAVELFDRTLSQLHATGAAVVAISGNHDSAVRVGYGDRLLEQLGVTVRGDVTRVGQAVELAPTDGGPPVRVHPIPYLDPLATAHHVRSGHGQDAARRGFSHHDAMDWAMQRVRADVTAAGPCRSVVVAHTFITGGDPSASERELSLGHVDQVGTAVFDGADYVALGHLHRRQAFDDGRIAYSGTPLAYSFSEQSDVKSVRLVDLAADGTCSAAQLELGVGRPLRTISGALETLLTDPALVDAENAWVRVVLTDRQLPLQAMARLQARFHHAVELSHEPAGVDPTALGSGAGTGAAVRAADPLELSLEFLSSRRGLDADELERALMADAVASVRTAGSATTSTGPGSTGRGGAP